MDQVRRCLEAGEETTVRTSLKGLGQGEEHEYIPVEGEAFPKDVEDRDTEVAGFELGALGTRRWRRRRYR